MFPYYKISELSFIEKLNDLPSCITLLKSIKKRSKLLCPYIYQSSFSAQINYQILQKVQKHYKDNPPKNISGFFTFEQQIIQSLRILCEGDTWENQEYRNYKEEVLEQMGQWLQSIVLDWYQGIGRKILQQGVGEWLDKLRNELIDLGSGAEGWREALEEQVKNSSRS